MSEQMIEPQWTTVDGLATRLWRDGQGKPLIWLHGAGGAEWLPLHARLAARYQVWLPEHPGFGQSAEADWIEGIDDLVFYYLDWIREFDLREVTLVGHSLGGWLAAELAVLTPAWLRRLVLIDAAGLVIPEAPIADIFVLNAEERAELVRYRPVGQGPMDVSETGPSRDAMAAIALDEATAHSRSRNDHMVARLAWNPYLANPKLMRRLGRIAVPTTVLWGVGDRLIPPQHGEAYARNIPGARLRWVEEAGHAPHRDNADAVLTAIVEEA